MFVGFRFRVFRFVGGRSTAVRLLRLAAGASACCNLGRYFF